MNEQSPGPTPTILSSKPSSNSIELERPSEADIASSSTSSFISHDDISSSTPSNTSADGNKVDTLLTFYQRLVPSHVRVFKRDHPDRRPNETDEEYEFRWQYYEYAKSHPLVDPSFFYDIEIKETLLVPMKDSSSLSSTNFTIIDGYEPQSDNIDITAIINTNDSQEKIEINDEQDEIYVWEIESNPNTLSMECPEELMQFSSTCLPLHSTVSLYKLSTLSPEQSVERLQLSSHPSGLPTILLFSLEDGILSKPSSKTVTFAASRSVRYYYPSQTSSTSSRSRSFPRAERDSIGSISSNPSKYLSSRSRSLSPVSHKSVKFRTFEEMFNRPSSIPSKSLLSTLEQRKQLWNQYTFTRKRGRRSKMNANLASKIKWSTERLHLGQPTASDTDNLNTSFLTINKSEHRRAFQVYKRLYQGF